MNNNFLKSQFQHKTHQTCSKRCRKKSGLFKSCDLNQIKTDFSKSEQDLIPFLSQCVWQAGHCSSSLLLFRFKTKFHLYLSISSNRSASDWLDSQSYGVANQIAGVAHATTGHSLDTLMTYSCITQHLSRNIVNFPQWGGLKVCKLKVAGFIIVVHLVNI